MLSSHLLDDVERVADRVAVMVDGRLLVDATLDNFRSRVAAWSLELPQDPTFTRTIPGLIHCRPVGPRWHVTVADPDAETTAAIERLGAGSAERLEITFEDAVLAYLSRSRVGHSFYRGVAS